MLALHVDRMYVQAKANVTNSSPPLGSVIWDTRLARSTVTEHRGALVVVVVLVVEGWFIMRARHPSSVI